MPNRVPPGPSSQQQQVGTLDCHRSEPRHPTSANTSPPSGSNSVATSISSLTSEEMPTGTVRTLRMPGPPLPPKPLYLTVSKNGTHPTGNARDDGRLDSDLTRSDGEEVGPRKGSRRGQLPTWNGAQEDDVSSQASTREEPAVEQLPGDSGNYAYSRAEGREASNEGSFHSACDTLKLGHQEAGTESRSRRSIYFDPSSKNPFVPSPLTVAAPLPSAVAVNTAPCDIPGCIQVPPAGPSKLAPSPEFSSTVPRSSSALVTECSPSPPPSQLEVPDSPMLAISLHTFSGEASFGELSFSQGTEVEIEIEDIGGGWSLGYLKKVGEKGRGLIPRGWYAYIDSEPYPEPKASSLIKPQDARVPIDTGASFATETPSLSLAAPSHQTLGAATRGDDRRTRQSYAIASIGRHLIVSGTDLEPIETAANEPQETELDTKIEVEHLAHKEVLKEDNQPFSTEVQRVVGVSRKGDGETRKLEELQSDASPSATPDLPSIPLSSLRLPPLCSPSFHTPSFTNSILSRLGLFNSNARTASSPLLGGLAIPGASILAHSHRGPSPASTISDTHRLSREPAAMSAKGYVMEWVRRGDELDREIGEDTQIWNIDDDDGPTWRISSRPFVVKIDSPCKISPLGESPFTLFRLTSVFDDVTKDGDGFVENNAPALTVSRRYSHFVSLHSLLLAHFSLVPIPSLPPKAFGATRFSDEFVEERRRDLERWCEQVVRHPVLRESEQVRGFLSITEDKELRAVLSPSHMIPPSPLFFARVFYPEFNIDLSDATEIGDHFERHSRAIELGEGIRAIEMAVLRFRESLKGNANSLYDLSQSLVRLVAGLALPPASYEPRPTADEIESRFNETDFARDVRRARVWKLQNEQGALSWTEDDPEGLALSKAVQGVGEALAELSNYVDIAARYDLVAVQVGLQELAKPATTYANLVSTHKSVLAEYGRLCDLNAFERADQTEQLARCETVLNITCAEMNLIRCHRLEDLRKVVEAFLDFQIEEKERALEQLRSARGHFDAEAFESLALTGPRLRSALEHGDISRSAHSPLPVAESFLVPRSRSAAVRGAIGNTFLWRVATPHPGTSASTLVHSRYRARDGDGLETGEHEE